MRTRMISQYWYRKRIINDVDEQTKEVNILELKKIKDRI